MMSFVGGSAPGPRAGDISALTEALRPPIKMTPEHCQAARRLRRGGLQIGEIANRLMAPEDEVRQALATMRTRKRRATRRSLNVTLAAHEFVRNEADPREVCWETVDRLLGELAFRRALAGAPLTKRSSL